MFYKIRISGPSEFFGEMALINNKPRSATVICEEDCVFACLVKKDYDRVLKVQEEKKYRTNIQYLLSMPIFS